MLLHEPRTVREGPVCGAGQGSAVARCPGTRTGSKNGGRSASRGEPPPEEEQTTREDHDHEKRLSE